MACTCPQCGFEFNPEKGNRQLRIDFLEEKYKEAKHTWSNDHSQKNHN